MSVFSFEAFGTHWDVKLDQPVFPTSIQDLILELLTEFDQKYSRFLPHSWLSQLNQSAKTKVVLDAQTTELLSLGQQLKNLTDGAFDPNITALLEAYGYDPSYSLKPKPELLAAYKKTPGSWHLKDKVLYRTPEVKLDIDAWGKGAAVDLIKELLEKNGFKNFLVNGSGDIWANQKENGSPWRAALEHPDDTTKAIGVVDLKRQALASSAGNRRKAGSFHHLLNAKTQKPHQALKAVYVLANSTGIADGVATAIFVSNPDCWERIATAFNCSFAVITKDNTLLKHPDFQAHFF